tara:strand:+ start:97 stop:498 length:402 start_codon:yes stop_codon:yes gene_type:complete
MSQHEGKIRVFRQNNVVIDIPSLVLDTGKTKECLQRAQKLAGTLDKWALFCIPDESVTITSEAAAKLATMIRDADESCAGIYVLTTSVNIKILRHAIESQQALPILHFESSVQRICEKIEADLGDRHVFSDLT